MATHLGLAHERGNENPTGGGLLLGGNHTTDEGWGEKDGNACKKKRRAATYGFWDEKKKNISLLITDTYAHTQTEDGWMHIKHHWRQMKSHRRLATWLSWQQRMEVIQKIDSHPFFKKEKQVLHSFWNHWPAFYVFLWWLRPGVCC